MVVGRKEHKYFVFIHFMVFEEFLILAFTDYQTGVTYIKYTGGNYVKLGYNLGQLDVVFLSFSR